VLRATLLVPLGVAIVLAGLASYGFSWSELFAEHPRALEIMKDVVRVSLEASWYIAFGVPVLILLFSLYGLVVASGRRGMVFLKMTAYVVLWALGSSALLGALLGAYLLGGPHAQIELLIPTTLGVLGYALIGLGLLASVLRNR
jgi:hypothetical protein